NPGPCCDDFLPRFQPAASVLARLPERRLADVEDDDRGGVFRRDPGYAGRVCEAREKPAFIARVFDLYRGRAQYAFPRADLPPVLRARRFRSAHADVRRSRT